MTLQIATTELQNAGVNATGCYATLPQIIVNAVDMAKTFGYNYWLNNTTSGPLVKSIVKKYSI